jgi:hypothetical protein
MDRDRTLVALDAMIEADGVSASSMSTTPRSRRTPGTPLGNRILAEAEALRDKLLMFRFANYGKRVADPSLVDPTIEPRLNQVFVRLLSVIDDERVRRDLREVLHGYQRQLVADRGLDTEAQVIEVIPRPPPSPRRR